MEPNRAPGPLRMRKLIRESKLWISVLDPFHFIRDKRNSSARQSRSENVAVKPSL